MKILSMSLRRMAEDGEANEFRIFYDDGDVLFDVVKGGLQSEKNLVNSREGVEPENCRACGGR